MLSFIYWLSRRFEQTHGKKADILYINRFHFEHLRQEFADPDDLDAIRRMLGMTILITEDAVNPHIARIDHTTDAQPPRYAGGGPQD